MMRYLLLIILSILPSAVRAKEARVVVTLRPLHSLVSMVMQGTGDTPQLLLSGNTSPHHFQLRPSQRQRLQHADMVFYMDDSLEAFMPSLLMALPAHTEVVQLSEQPGMHVLPLRRSTDFEANYEEEHEGMNDPHLWLDPFNAYSMIDVIAFRLSQRFPSQALLYKRNALRLQQRFERLHDDIQQRLPRRNPTFLLFHDATQYFEQVYDLKAAGAVHLGDGQQLGMRRLSELQAKLKDEQVDCVFYEQEAELPTLQRMVQGTTAKPIRIDVLGTTIQPGHSQYFTLMGNLSWAFSQCAK